mgnify:CR=1 FL=1
MQTTLSKKILFVIFSLILTTIIFLPLITKAEELPVEENIESPTTTPENQLPEEPNTTTTTENNTTTTPEVSDIVTPTTTTNYYSVQVNYLGNSIFSGTISPTSTYFVDANQSVYTNANLTALGALAEAGRIGNFPVEIQNYGWGYYVSAINNQYPTGFDGWVYNVNQVDPGWTGINDYILQPNDLLTVFYSVWPWKIEANTTTATTGEQITFTASQYQNNGWQIAPSTTISINSEKFVTDNNGQYVFTTSTTGTVNAYIFGTDAWPQNSPAISVSIIEPVATTTETNTGGGSGGGSPTPITYLNLDVTSAINFLTTQQTAGDFSSTLNTDWAAIAFGAYDKNHPTSQAIKNYLITDPSAVAGFNSVSDYARRAMALMSLGINPYTTPTNYIEKIVDAFDGNQIGDATIFNDDIFALLVLSKAGYSATDEITQKTIDFITTKQSNDNWGGIDMTAAAIQSLKPYSEQTAVADALTKAQQYIEQNQNTDGSFSHNPYSTAWAIQAGDALGQTETEWVKKAKNYLAVNQKTDGSVVNDVWATTQAIPAALDKNWNEVMVSFEKYTPATFTATPVIETSNFVTSTEQITTTTIALMTSTEPIIDPVLLETSSSSPEIIVEKKPEAPNATVLNTKIIQPITPTPSANAPTTISENTTPSQEELAQDIINELPIDTSHKKTAKKVLAFSGGSATAIGLYLGLRLLKNMI